MKPSTALTVLLAAAGTALFTPAPTAHAAVTALEAQRDVKKTQDVKIAHVADKPVHVRTDNGSIKLVKKAVPEVVVTFRLRSGTQERLDGVKTHVERATDGMLKAWVEWPGGKTQSKDACDIEVTIPNANGLDLQTANGEIAADEFSGPATLKTSNGAIRVKHHAGAVKASTSNGEIELEGAPAADLSTSNGKITVALNPDAPGPINATTSNGAISASVGEKMNATITCTTSNGKVTIPAGSGTVNKAKTFGTITLGDGSQKCAFKTSNGSIRVSKR